MRLALFVVLAACATPQSKALDAGSGATDASSTDAKPAVVDALKDASSGSGQPLVLLLHGYNTTGAKISTEWHVGAIASRAVVLAPDAPHGTSWSASHSCCDLANDDDEDYLVGLVTDRIAQGDIDPARVYVVGHSNGGFMAWRLLCDHADLFVAGVVASGAGNSVSDPACSPWRPLRVLHVHGTADSTVAYEHGGTLLTMPDAYVAAIGPQGTTDQEAFAAGCIQPLAPAGKADGVLTPTGSAADVDVFTRPCAGRADLWRINGGIHAFGVDATWMERLMDWLEAS